MPRTKSVTVLLAAALILVGTALRLGTYLQNPSLWLDEALVSTNITTQSWRTLLQAPPVNDQVAPPGFLLSVKGVTMLTGSSEWSLRLLPLIAGVLGMIAFWYLVRRLLPTPGALMALALFALSEPLIYYSNEVKPYGIDALAVTLILLTLTRAFDTRLSWLAIIFCIVVPWISYPSGLVLGVGAVVLFAGYTSRQNRAGLNRLIVLALLGLVSAVALYLTAMRPSLSHRGLADYWTGFFAPLPLSFAAVQWYYSSIRHLFDYALGALSGVAILAAAAGLMSLYPRNRRLFFLLVATPAVALVASGLHLYPFSNRLLLFLFPAILLAVGEGFTVVYAASRKNGLGVVMAALLILDPLLHAATNVASVHSGEEIRPLLSWLRASRETGDLIYTVDSTKYAFSFYASRFGFTDSDIQLGACTFGNFERCADFERVRKYRRVWVVYSRGDKTTTDFILHQFGELGHQASEFHQGRAAVWLFQLGDPSAPGQIARVD